MTCFNTGYTGQKFCVKGSALGKPTGIILAKSTFSQSAANFLLQAQWAAACKAAAGLEPNVFPILGIKDFQDNSTDTNWHEFADESRKKMGDGKYRFTVFVDANECYKKELRSFKRFSEGVYFIYGDHIRGRSIDAGVTVKPIRLAGFEVGKESFPLGDGTAAMLPLYIDLYDAKDVNEYDYVREMTWSVNDNIDGLTEVALTVVGNPSATTIVVDVAANCTGNANPITGLVFADFTAPSGASSSAESATIPGRYTISGTGMASGHVNLVASASISVASYFIVSAGEADVTI